MSDGRSNSKKFGLIIIVFGLVWVFATGASLSRPLSDIELGPLEVGDISEYSTVNLFIGFGLIIIGTGIYLRVQMIMKTHKDASS